jgi:hypothetical protein
VSGTDLTLRRAVASYLQSGGILEEPSFLLKDARETAGPSQGQAVFERKIRIRAA